eukprot:m.200821 g.200821  ORF g.200821 m.200821 type:complete len:152 (+) comp17056_c0_seq8:2981-3436(+)
MRFLKTKITQRPPPHTVLIVTYTGELLYHEDITQSDELIPRVTMPIGLFEQLVGRLIQQSSDPYWNKLPISRGFAAVCLQDLLVTLEPHASGRMIQVQLYANNVSGLLRQVSKLAGALDLCQSPEGQSVVQLGRSFNPVDGCQSMALFKLA